MRRTVVAKRACGAVLAASGMVAACGRSGGDAGGSAATTTVVAASSSVSSAPSLGTTSGTTASSTSDTSPSSATSGGSAAECPQVGTTTEVKVNFPDRLSSLVGKEIRAAAQPCADRVVVELQPGTAPTGAAFPGYWVRYSHEPLTYSPSDQPATIKGSAVLLISIGSWMHSMDDPTPPGQGDITPTGTTAVEQLLLVENFEGMSTWAVGLDAEHPCVVTTLDNPPRLVIDIETSSPA